MLILFFLPEAATKVLYGNGSVSRDLWLCCTSYRLITGKDGLQVRSCLFPDLLCRLVAFSFSPLSQFLQEYQLSSRLKPRSLRLGKKQRHRQKRNGSNLLTLLSSRQKWTGEDLGEEGMKTR